METVFIHLQDQVVLLTKMANYAQINFDNIVTQVVALDNSVSNGSDFLNNLFGGTWVQTSYNTYGGIHYGPNGLPDGGQQIGYNYAGVGYNYDPIAKAFYIKQPWPSWNLDKSTYTWIPPVDYPSDKQYYHWDEQNKNWILNILTSNQ